MAYIQNRCHTFCSLDICFSYNISYSYVTLFFLGVRLRTRTPYLLRYTLFSKQVSNLLN
nr:MAG TPA: hypothetical protein [Caudoviricetes sp.]